MIKISLSMHDSYAVTVENLDTEADKAVDYINKELPKILGEDFSSGARFNLRLGKSLDVRFLRVANPSLPNNIEMNAIPYCSFIMHLTDNSGNSTNLEKVSLEASLIPRSLKFRKITSKKSILDVAQKFIVWVKKNKEQITTMTER